MAIDDFQIPLIVFLIISLIGVVGAFVAGAVPKSLGKRHTVVWVVSLILPSIAFLLGNAALIMKEPEYQRGSVTVVWGTYLMTLFSHPLVMAGIAIVTSAHLRHILAPPALNAVVHGCMIAGVLVRDNNHRWYFLGFALLFHILSIVAMFLPYFGQGSAGRSPSLASKKSTWFKRLIFQILSQVIETIFIIVWVLDPSMGDIISRVLFNYLSVVIQFAVLLIAFLVFLLFDADVDPEVGGATASDVQEDSGAGAEDEEAPLPPADQTKTSTNLFNTTTTRKRANGALNA